jgi:hypothetical protein
MIAYGSGPGTGPRFMKTKKCVVGNITHGLYAYQALPHRELELLRVLSRISQKLNACFYLPNC